MSNMIMSLLQTNAVIALVIGAFVTYLVKWLASDNGQMFKKYEGIAITLCKAAMDAIPDDTPNKGAARADFVLGKFVEKYTAATGVKPDSKQLVEIASWISVIHNALVESGTLKGSVK